MRSRPALHLMLCLFGFGFGACSPSTAHTSTTASLTSVVPTAFATATFPAPPLIAGPPPVSGLLGPIPTNCAVRQPPATRMYNPFGGGFFGPMTLHGGGPFWYTRGFSDDLRLSLESYGGYVPQPSTKMLWADGPSNTQVVTLSGWEVTTHTPMWIQRYELDSGASTSVAFPPGHGNRPGTTTPDGATWAIWGTGLYFTRAGWYDIHASWSGGAWDMVLAVGR